MNSCVCVHPGCDASQHLRSRQAFRVQRFETVELVEAVDHDVPHTFGDGRTQLGEALVVAVERKGIGRHAGAERNVQLAAAGNVEVHALLVREPGHRGAQERLGCVVGAAGAERSDGFAQRARRCASS